MLLFFRLDDVKTQWGNMSLDKDLFQAAAQPISILANCAMSHRRRRSSVRSKSGFSKS
jgi:hypothetical protein